jgi:VanZ family protein
MIAVMAIIFSLSHTSGDNIPSAINGLDKICHAIAYASLSLTCLYAIHPIYRHKKIFWAGCAVIIFSLTFGISDEYHQSFIAGRSPDWQDLVADTVGASFSVICWIWWNKRHLSPARANNL